MAYSLRKRISKRIANANSKSTSPDSDAESPSCESKSELTQDFEDGQPLLKSDLDVSSQPSPRKLRSSTKNSSSTTSPPQSLRDRLRSREPKGQVKAAKSSATYKAGKDTAFSEHFDDDSATMSSEWVDVPGTPEPQVYDGVEFEMMGQKGQAAEAPKGDEDDEFVFERRASYFQSHREQRADSADSTDDTKDTKDTTKENNLVPTALTVRKVIEKMASRTPSPNATAINNSHSPGKVAPTPANSPSTTALALSTPTTLVVDRTKGKAEYRLSTTPDPIDSEKTTKGFGRKLPQLPIKNDHDIISTPTPVLPPMYHAKIRLDHIWTSPLTSSSRPDNPWGWMRKWVCCSCAHLDSTGRNLPAETMAEQKVCSRIKCRHVRCGMGCRMSRDSTFDKVNSLMSS